MPKIINTAYCKLIGLCCVKGQERDRIYKEWSEQFRDHDAFWLDVDENQTGKDMAIAVTRMIARQHIGHMAKKPVVIAAFLDLTQEPNTQLLKEIGQVAGWLHGALGCNVSVTVEFGDLREMAFADKEELRSNVKKAVEANCETPDSLKPLYLVASSPLVMPEDDCCWKSVIIFLDILRREPDPASLIQGGNPHGDVGFLRYGQYEEEKLNNLSGEKESIADALGKDGDQRLKNLVDEECGTIAEEIKKNYPVDGTCQPIHPDMIVNGAFRRMLASHGNLASYEAARNSTEFAVSMTGIKLKETILEAYQYKISNAGDDLVRFIEEAGVGLKMQKDKVRMESILSPGRMTVAEPSVPKLNYRPEGPAGDIAAYLAEVRRYAEVKVKFDYCNALCEAYKAIPESEYQQKQKELKDQGDRIDTHLEGILDRKGFINMVESGAALPMTCFYPVLGGGKQSNWAIARTLEDADELDSHCTGSKTSVYFIDEETGGLKTVDNAPIKALQILLFDCDDDRLRDLI